MQQPDRMHSQNRQQIGVSFNPPFIKHRCHSCNHDSKHPNIWKTIYEETVSPENPPDKAIEIQLKDLNKDHECIYIYAPVSTPFRIHLSPGIKDIVSVCATFVPYTTMLTILYHSRQI